MIALLSGARRNVGDHLITARTRALLEEYLDEEVIWIPNWEPLDDRFDELAEARLLVVAGGPGLRSNLYGGVYPLFTDPEAFTKLKADLVFLGAGWKGMIGDRWDYRTQRFDARTRTLIDSLRERVRFSTRDLLSDELLRRQGIDSVMTGCPVWYHLPSIGAPLCAPKELRRIVFTEPVNSQVKPQSLRLLAALQEAYPAAEIVASFHHGFDGIEPYVAQIQAMGIETCDVAADLSKIDFYDDFDVHVGYRVHAGLYFLSKRKPSLIISEDARGRGSAEAVGAPWIGAWDYTAAGRVVRNAVPFTRLGRRMRLLSARQDVSADVLRVLADELRSGWASYSTIPARIDGHLEVMERFIRSM